MRLLVTGASGFIGLALTKALIARGHHVVALNRSAPDALNELAQRDQVTLVRGDVADRDAVARATEDVAGVFHVAAKAGVIGPYRDYYASNVRGTEHVIEAMKARGIDKLVFTSSPSVVHGGADVKGLDESAPYPEHHSAPYPETKAIAERAVLAADGTVLANGKTLRTVALRPHLVWGPGDPNLAPRILDRARKGRLVLVGGGHAMIDATHIDSAVHAHLCAWDVLSGAAACAGKAYFIAQGEPLKVREIIFGMLRAAGLPERAREVPLPVALAMGSIVERVFRWTRPDVEPPLTRFVAEQLGTSHYFDLGAARRDLQYQAPISTEEGLRRLAAFWQANGAP